MNLIEGLQAEVNRRREILEQYRAIGPAGAFGAAFLEVDIRIAETAIASGDLVLMVQEYRRLSEIEVK
jgi:hypothetical protein